MLIKAMSIHYIQRHHNKHLKSFQWFVFQEK